MAAPKLALVTGGNRGIGLEVCRQLVAAGKPVLLASRDLAAGAAAAEQLAADEPGAAPATPVRLDAGCPDSIAALAERVRCGPWAGEVDLLICNAGIGLPGAWSEAALAQTLAVNLSGPVALTLALAPHLAPGALVVFVSSTLGCLKQLAPAYQGRVTAASDLASLARAVPFDAEALPFAEGIPQHYAYSPVYSVSKLLLNRAVQLLAADARLVERGLRIAATCPGWCRTDMGGPDADRSAQQGAASVLWPWAHWEPQLHGSFTRDGSRLEW